MSKAFQVAPRYPTEQSVAATGSYREATLYAGAHRDKATMCLVSTRGKSTPGEPKDRLFCKWEDGQVNVSKFVLQQPHMHALYRNNFNAVDVYNRQALGAGSLCQVLGSKVWWHRVFAGFLSLCETNAYLAYCATVKQVQRQEFQEQLAYELCNFKEDRCRELHP